MITARNTENVIAAETLKGIFDEYVRVGFTRGESLKITLHLMSLARRGK